MWSPGGSVFIRIILGTSFKKKKMSTWLAALGLNCGMQDLQSL